MLINKVKSRTVVFTKELDGWDLHIQLIKGSKYNYLIDTGLGPIMMDEIKNYLKDDNKELIVINTHYHFDHILGNSAFKDNLIVSSNLTKDKIDKDWDKIIKDKEAYFEGNVSKILADISFSNELYFNEDKIRLFLSPGHTVDSISVLDEVDKILNIGDNIGDSLEYLIPSLELSSEEFIVTIEDYLDLDFETIISGHIGTQSRSLLNDLITDLKHQ